MCAHAVSTAPRKQTVQRSSDKPLTKNQRKKLKKKLKRQKEREREEGGRLTEETARENGDRKTSVPSPMATDSGDPVTPGNGDKASSGEVVVNGGGGEGSENGERREEEEEEEEEGGGDGASGNGESGEKREEGVSEEESVMVRQWGPLKRPIQVKIADLGNACWVVSQSQLVYTAFKITLYLSCLWECSRLYIVG